MKSNMLYRLINRNIIEGKKDSQEKRYYYKVINTYPDYFLAMHTKGSSTFCSPAYIREVKNSFVIMGDDERFYWIKYDYFIYLPDECLEKADIKLKDIELFSKRLENKHTSYMNNIYKEKKEERERKRKLKKQAKKDGKHLVPGVPKNFVSGPINDRKHKPNTGGSISWKRISSAGRGDKY